MTDKHKDAPVLQPGRLELAEHRANRWRAIAEAGTSVEQVCAPDYWAHHAKKLRPYDEIAAVCDDGTFYARLLVLSCDRTYARVFLLEQHALTTREIAQSQDEKYEIQWKGPKLLHCIVRKADAALIKSEISTKVQAVADLEQYKRTIGA